MEMKLDDEALKSVMAKAIMDTLTPESRERLISDAVQRLLTTKVSDHYDAPSKLQNAFDQAVQITAQQIAREIVGADDTIKAKIKEMFEKAWHNATVGDNANVIIDKVAQAISKAFSNDRY